jgi:uncharacterized protein (PEP-CTERM system associated)
MTRRRAEPRCLAFALLAWAALAQAQGTGGRGGVFAVSPRLSATQTLTDNLQLSERDKDAAVITTVSPGVSISSRTGVLQGSLDYAMNGILYSKTDQPSRVQNALSATGRASLVPEALLVDMQASIGQQNVSAFGLQSAPSLDGPGGQGGRSSLANSNQRETLNYSISPLLQGRLGGLASYALRGEFTGSDARGSELGDSRGRGVSLQVDQSGARALAWWLQLNARETTSAGGANSVANPRTSSLRLGANYRPDPDWVFSANAGQERSNYLGNAQQSGTTAGATASWSPSARTRLGLDWQRHAYGNSHGISLEHRLARSVLRYSDQQSTVVGNTGSAGGARSNYDQFFLLFASQEPDPVKRDTLVRAYLQSQGLSPDAVVAGGFLSTGPSRLRSQQLAVTLQGVRASLTGQFSRSVSGRLGSNVNQGSLADSATIEQRSMSLSASYQLSATSGLTLIATRQEVAGDTSRQSTQLTSYFANWTARLGNQLSAQLGARHSRFAGVTSYTENAMLLTLTQQF